MANLAVSTRRRNLSGLTAGYVLIALAVSILISYSIDKFWYALPIFMIALGAYVIFLGTLPRTPGRDVRSGMIYTLTWGGIMAVLGVLLITNDLLPNNAIVLIAVFLIFLGAIAVVAFATRPK